MSKHILKFKFLIIFLVGLAGSIAYLTFAKAQTDSLDDRMERKITLDVRDRNIVDVIKFLAQKGEFNVIIAPSVEGRSTVLLHDVGIKDALDIVVIYNKLAYHIDDDIVQVMTAGEYEAMYGKQFSHKREVSMVHLQYAKPSYVLAALDNMRSKRGKIIIDKDTGSVVLVDTPQSIALMKKAIEQIEQQLGTVEKPIRSVNVPAKEVLIEARVLQIVKNPAGTSSSRVLSTPQILVANNEKARIHIGDTVPYIVATTNGTGKNAITSNDVHFVDVGLKLSVVPTINDDGTVTMKLTPEIFEVVAAVKSAEGGTIPQVNKTGVETSVKVKDGQTLNIPFTGGAFSRTWDKLTNAQIVILITPHIVKGDSK